MALKKSSLFLLCFSYTLMVNSQLILPAITSNFDRYPNFNRDWIKKNNIKGLTFDILDKKDYQPGKDEGIVEKYEFDNEGRLIRFYFTEIAKQSVKETYVPVIRRKKHKYGGYTKHEKVFEYDTISTRFYYDDKDRLKLTRYNEGSYYESNYYEYDAEGRVTRELRCKETNLTHGSGIFTLGVQNIISEEKFEYVKTSSKQYKKKCINDEGRVFREVIVNLNETNNITEMNESFTVTWISQKTRFWYNEHGQLSQKTFESNADGVQAIRDTFEYDNNRNIAWERQYMNGVLLNERSYIFDNTGNSITSFLIRNHTEKSLRITKLIYEFRKPE